MVLATIALGISLFCLTFLGWLIKRVSPIMKLAKDAISQNMAIVGQKGRDAKKVKKGEKLIFADLLGQFPEVKMVVEYFSPETMEFLEENPYILATLLQRYAPLLQKITGKVLSGEGSQNYEL